MYSSYIDESFSFRHDGAKLEELDRGALSKSMHLVRWFFSCRKRFSIYDDARSITEELMNSGMSAKASNVESSFVVTCTVVVDVTFVQP